jgi:hypothetical protein
LNLPVSVRDQVQVTLGISCMKTVRPDNSDPIPFSNSGYGCQALQ